MAFFGAMPLTSELVAGAALDAGVTAAPGVASQPAMMLIAAITGSGRNRITRGFYVIVHLIDGTYELFRHFYAVPPAADSSGQEIAAVRGVIGSLRGMLNSGVATHMGVA